MYYQGGACDMCTTGQVVYDVEEMVRLRPPRAYSRGEKRWPAGSVFIDDDKPCRGCHSNHPPFVPLLLRYDSGSESDAMLSLSAPAKSSASQGWGSVGAQSPP